MVKNSKNITWSKIQKNLLRSSNPGPGLLEQRRNRRWIILRFGVTEIFKIDNYMAYFWSHNYGRNERNMFRIYFNQILKEGDYSKVFFQSQMTWTAIWPVISNILLGFQSRPSCKSVLKLWFLAAKAQNIFSTLIRGFLFISLTLKIL